jgi:hypothetical protein
MKRKGYHPLTSIQAELPFDHVSIDLCKMELSVSGMNYVLVVKDVLTKFIILRALLSKSAEEVAKALWDIFTLMGFPKIIQSDNGTEFRNQILAAWSKFGLFEHRMGTPYHPRANGMVERANGDIIRMLKALCVGKTTAWCQFLPTVQFYRNVSVSRTHRSSPYSLMFLRRHNPFSMNMEEIKDLSEEQLQIAEKKRKETLKEAMKVIYPAAARTLKEYHEKQKEQLERHNKLIERLPAKSTVMIINRNKTKKLDDNYIGPFTVVRVNRGGAYQLLDSTGSLLPRAVAPADIRVVALPEPNELCYEVDKILDDKVENGLQLYLVKWKDYDDSFNTWEPVSSFDSLECIMEYNRSKIGSV